VDEVLALPSTKLKHAKRNLRIQPCKALPTALGGREIKPIPDAKAKVNAKAKVTAGDKKKSMTTKKPPVVILPQVSGDPTLGAKISTLNKDERKAFKSSDPTRLARRAAKKQSAKLKLELAGKRDKVKLDVRGTSKRLAGGKEKVKGKKSRVRSEHAATKMKGKRD
jgi:nucleolar protein 12